MKTSYKTHKNNPANQPFQGSGSRSKAKVESWWNPSSKTYWAAKKK